MPSKPKYHFSSSAAATRPEVSPEEEAEACGLAVSQVHELRERLEQSEPGPSRHKAMDDCVKWLSIPVTEAAIILGVLPSIMSRDVRRWGGEGTFQHKGRWRMWTTVVREAEKMIRSQGD